MGSASCAPPRTPFQRAGLPARDSKTSDGKMAVRGPSHETIVEQTRTPSTDKHDVRCESSNVFANENPHRSNMTSGEIAAPVDTSCTGPHQVIEGAYAISASQHEGDAVFTRGLLRKTVTSLIVIVAVAALCGYLLGDIVTELGSHLVERFGMWGVMAAVLCIDSSPIPLTNEPIIVLAIAGGVPFWTVTSLASVASATAGMTGYSAGALLHRVSRARERLVAWNPQLAAWIRRRGAIAVAIAALLPIPFALSTWTAGVMGVRWKGVALASLLRIPKTFFYSGLLYFGWSVGS